MDAPTKSTHFLKTLHALVAAEEPDPQYRARHLGDRLGRRRQTGDRLLKVGTDSISLAKHVADAFDMPLSALIDAGHEDATVIRLNIPVGLHQTQAIAVEARIDPAPHLPFCDNEPVACLVDGGFWLRLFCETPDGAPSYRIRWIEGVGELLPQGACTVAIYATQQALASMLRQTLSRAGCEVLISNEAELRSGACPDAAIIYGYHVERTVQEIRAKTGRRTPAIVLDPVQSAHDVQQRIFYSQPAPPMVLMLLREIVHF